MKTQRTLPLLLAALFLIGSCKKDSDKNSNCRIVTVTQEGSGSTSIFNMTYNDQGKIATFSNSTTNGTTNKVFTYSGNTVIVNVISGSSASRDSITLGANGKVLNIRRFPDLTGNDWTNYSFEYNGDVLLKFIESHEGNPTPLTTVVTVTDGNMTRLETGSSTTDLTYYTDKQMQPGGYIELAMMIEYGISIYPHKNLVKSIDYGGGDIATYEYEFDADGKISKAISSQGGYETTLSYQYQCH